MFKEVLFDEVVATWISLQLTEQKEGLFVFVGNFVTEFIIYN